MNIAQPAHTRTALDRYFFVFLGVLALLALATIYISTLHGAGIGGDATIYIVSARNLLEGRGLGLIEPDGSFRLLPYFAPFFSLVLAFLGLFVTDLAEAARWLNILLFAGLIGLAGAVTFRVTRSALWGLLAALTLLVSPILIPVYSWAMSEPLALLLGFAGLWLVFLAARRPEARPAFFASAVLVGFSFLTRYSSAAFVLTGVLLLLFFRPGAWTARIKAALLYGGLAALPMLPWLAVNLACTATVSSRSLESAAGMASRFTGFWPRFLDAVLSWLIPFSWIEDPFYPALFNRALPLILLAGLLAWLALSLRGEVRSAPEARDPRLLWALTLALLAGSYLLVVLLVYTITYPPITIENRMLSPVHVAVLWLVVMLASAARPGSRWLAAALPLAVLLFAGWSYLRSDRIVEQNAAEGLGYNSIAWRSSETVQAVNFLNPGTRIVTNEVTALLYLTGRSAYALQEIYRDQPAAEFSAYGSGDLTSDEAQRRFARGEAVLVLFDSLPSQIEGLYGDQTAARITALVDGLRLVYQAEDGAIYTAPAGAAP